jgi:hypothetical protein
MRFRDFRIFEYAPPDPEDQMGAEPAPVQQQAQPKPTPPAPVKQIKLPTAGAAAPKTAPASPFGAHVVSLIKKTARLPDTDPTKQFVNHLIQALDSVPDVPVQEDQSGPKTNRAYMNQYADTKYNAKLERVRALNPDLAAQFELLVAQADETLGPVENEPTVKKAMTASIKGIKLDAYGEIFIKDKRIRDLADQKASDLGMDKKWARNLIGMFDASISYDDREEFLRLCSEGKALDLQKMIKLGHGSIEQVVVEQPKTIREVFKSIKGTLLDISLSTGQGAATGPFEAMLAIMGGARKAATGDMEIDVNGVANKFEVKSCSISSSFGHSNAWLDAPSEMPPATVKGYFEEAMGNRYIAPGANFREAGLPALKETFQSIKNRATRLQILKNFHGSIFTSITDVTGYDFDDANQKILDAILKEDHQSIARQQMIMAMLEYAVGKDNDGFIFYNSSFQTFRVIYGPEQLLEFAKNPEKFGVSALGLTMNMKPTATTRKGSPGIYFGSLITSPEGSAYKEKIKSDPQWQKTQQHKLAAKKSRQNKV